MTQPRVDGNGRRVAGGFGLLAAIVAVLLAFAGSTAAASDTTQARAAATANGNDVIAALVALRNTIEAAHDINIPTIDALRHQINAAKDDVKTSMDPCPDLARLAFLIVQKQAEGNLSAAETASYSASAAAILEKAGCPPFAPSPAQQAYLDLVVLLRTQGAVVGPHTKLGSQVRLIQSEIANNLPFCPGLDELALLIFQEQADGILTDQQASDLSTLVAAIATIAGCPPFTPTGAQKADIDLRKLKRAIQALTGVPTSTKSELKNQVEFIRADLSSSTGDTTLTCNQLAILLFKIQEKLAWGDLTAAQAADLQAQAVRIAAELPCMSTLGLTGAQKAGLVLIGTIRSLGGNVAGLPVPTAASAAIKTAIKDILSDIDAGKNPCPGIAGLKALIAAQRAGGKLTGPQADQFDQSITSASMLASC